MFSIVDIVLDGLGFSYVRQQSQVVLHQITLQEDVLLMCDMQVRL